MSRTRHGCIIQASFSQERMQYLDQKGKEVSTSKDGMTSKNFPALEYMAILSSHIPTGATRRCSITDPALLSDTSVQLVIITLIPDRKSSFRYGFSSFDFCFPPSTEQDWFVQPGPPRLGSRHPNKKYQMTTTISNNQTQFMSVSFDDLQYDG